MEELAEITGGRLFVSQSIHDLEGVYPLVEDELRSVYLLGYYPKNRNQNGSWRRIEVRVKIPNATARTRSGYFAR